MIRPGELVGRGRTSDVYAFGAGAVVKVSKPQVPPEWPQIEAELTDLVHARGVPAPAVEGMVNVDGRDAVVFARIDGDSMWQHMVDRPDQADALTRVLVDVHRTIARAGPIEGLPDLVDRISTKVRAVESLTDAQQVEACAIADALPRGAALLHGDLHPQNVLMSKSGPVVIDWFDAAIGHPVADVVRSSILMRPPSLNVELPHLPGAPAGILTEVHDRYVAGFVPLLSNQTAALARWEAVIGLSRMAEQAQHDESALLSLWMSRSSDNASAALVTATE